MVHRQKISLLIIGIISLIFLAACGGDTSGDSLRGEEVFNTGGSSNIPCLICHSLDGSPLVGPSLQGIGERAGSILDGQSAEDYISQSITSPSAYITPGYSDAMNPEYGTTLTEQEIDDLVAFLLEQ